MWLGHWCRVQGPVSIQRGEKARARQQGWVPSLSRWMEHSREGAKECAARRVTTAEEERRRMPMSVGVGGRLDMGTKLS